MQSVDGDVRLSVGLETKSLKANLSNLSNKISSIFKQSSQSADKASSSMMNLQNNIRNTSNKLDDLIRKQDRLGKQKIPTEEYKAISSQIEKAQMRLNRLMAKQDEYVELGKSKKSTVWAKMQRDIKETTMEIQYAKGELQELIDTGKAFTLGADTDAYRKLGQDIDNYKAKLESLNVKQDEANAKQEKTHKTVSPLRKGVSKLFKTWRDKMKEPFERMKRFGMMFKNMMLMSMGMMAILGAARMLLQGVAQGFKNLSKQSQEVNEDISMVVSSLTHLKNSLATAFQPILSVIAPILSAFIDLLSAAAAAVASFFAALTGQGYIYKATKANENFAASIAGAGGAAKEANQELAEYDKLMVIQQEASGGGGGGGGALGEAGTFEKAEIAPGIASVVDLIKKSWKNSDFTEIGSIIAEDIRMGLDKIPWDKIKETASRAAKSLATLLNGIFETPGLFAEIGETLAEALNTIFTIKADFFKTLNWEAIGTSIGDFINEFITTIEWDTLAEAIGSLATGLLSLLTSALETIEWEEVGEAISEFLGALPWGELLKGVGELIGAALSGGIDLLKGAGDFLVGGTGTAVSNVANNLLSSGDVAEGLSDISLDITKLFPTEKEVEKLAEKTGEAYNEGLKNGINEKDVNDYADDVLATLFNEDKTEDLATDVYSNAFKATTDSYSTSKMGNHFLGVKSSIFSALVDVPSKFSALFTNAATNTKNSYSSSKIIGHFNSIATGVVNAFGKVPTQLGAAATTASTNTTKPFNNVPSTFSSIFASASTNVKAAFSATDMNTHFTSVAASVKSPLSAKVMNTHFSTVFAGAAASVKTSFTTDAMTSHFTSVASSVKSPFSTIPQYFKTTFSTAWGNVKSVFSDTGGVISGVATASQTVFQKVVNGLIGGLNSSLSTPFSTINRMITKLKNFKFAGMTPFANLSTISVPDIPFLAEGAVIPPNQEFMAVLGDQKRGVNIETPLETMIQAFNSALDRRGGDGGSREPIILQISGRTIAELVWDASAKRYKQSGVPRYS